MVAGAAVRAVSGADTDERHVAGGDARLHLVALGLGDLPGRNGGVDAILERLLQSCVESPVSTPSCLAASATTASLSCFGRQLVGRDRRAATDQCGCRAP